MDPIHVNGKPTMDSQVTLHHFILPQHADPLGTIEERQLWAEGEARQKRRLEGQAQEAADQ
jgi:hypothetical protein